MMTKGKKIIYAVKERLKAGSTTAVTKRTSFTHGINDKLAKQFA